MQIRSKVIQLSFYYRLDEENICLFLLAKYNPVSIQHMCEMLDMSISQQLLAKLG